MLDQLDRDLLAWVAALPDIPDVNLQAPDDRMATKGISVYLMDVRPDLPQRNIGHSTWRFHARYLVSAIAPDPLEAHRLLGNVLIAALQREDVEIEGEATPLALWTALGVKPRPSFMLSIAWSYQKDAPKGPVVRHPLTVDPRPLGRLSGIVVGPEDVPVMAARVEIPLLGLSATTDHLGRFHFPSTPQGADLPLRIMARGKVVERKSMEARGPDGNIVVKLEL